MTSRTLAAAVVSLLLLGGLAADLTPRARGQDPQNLDEKLRSPRSTVQTFLRAVSISEEVPKRIELAVACMDFSDQPRKDHEMMVRLAKRLEAILSVKEINTELIPDTDTVPGIPGLAAAATAATLPALATGAPDAASFVALAALTASSVTPGDTYVIPDPQGDRLILKRGDLDGHWLFDTETLAAIPKMWPAVQKRLQEKNREAAALSISPEFASPRATIWTFTTSYYRHDTERVLRCLDLSEIPTVAREEVGEQLANKLRQIMYRLPIIIFQEVPDTNYSVPYSLHADANGVVEVVRIAAGPRKGEWVFSRETVRSIDHLYNLYEELPHQLDHPGTTTHLPTFWHAPELWMRDQMPGWLKTPLLGRAAVVTAPAPPPGEQGQPPVPGPQPAAAAEQPDSRPGTAETKLHLALYELLGYVLLLVLAGAVTWLATWLLVLLVRGFVSWRKWVVPPETIKRRLRPSGFFVGCVVLRWGVLVLGGSEPLMVTFLYVLNPLIWILGTWALFRWIDLIGDLVEAHLVAGKRGVEIAQMLWPVGSLASKIALFLVMMFHLMWLFAWDVSTVLAGLGIGGVAFALGAQDSLKNLFGSFTLIADRPFVVGENVRIGDRDVGVVEVVGLRSTRIRTADDTLLIVPNSNLTTMNITNYGRRRYRRLLTHIGVVYGTPPDKLLAFRDGIRQIIMTEKRTRKSAFDVAVNELGDSAIKIVVSVFFEVADARQESEARESLILAILELADRLHIDLAFPTQTVHLVPPAEPTDGRAVQRPAATAAAGKKAN